jgi:mono/diheme cytochrome c family protein
MKTLMLAFAMTSALWALASALPALADDDRRNTPPPPAAYVQECGSCHTAYAAGLLPVASWTRLVRGLEKHYGTDASLGPAALKPIEAWLMAHGGTSKRGREEPPEDRITRAAWFERKHRKIDAPVWKLPSVKTAANCQACHRNADQGSFSERELVTPAGVSLWQRRAFID